MLDTSRVSSSLSPTSKAPPGTHDISQPFSNPASPKQASRTTKELIASWNNTEDLCRWITLKHSHRIKVFNLCAESRYQYKTLGDLTEVEVESFPLEPFALPSFELVEAFIASLSSWLLKDRQNVALIHCDSGRGRTGLMVCAYLLKTGAVATLHDAIRKFVRKRNRQLFEFCGPDRSHVLFLSPSQLRWLQYYASYHQYLSAATKQRLRSLGQSKSLSLRRLVLHCYPREALGPDAREHGGPSAAHAGGGVAGLGLGLLDGKKRMSTTGQGGDAGNLQGPICRVRIEYTRSSSSPSASSPSPPGGDRGKERNGAQALEVLDSWEAGIPAEFHTVTNTVRFDLAKAGRELCHLCGDLRVTAYLGPEYGGQPLMSVWLNCDVLNQQNRVPLGQFEAGPFVLDGSGKKKTQALNVVFEKVHLDGPHNDLLDLRCPSQTSLEVQFSRSFRARTKAQASSNGTSSSTSSTSSGAHQRKGNKRGSSCSIHVRSEQEQKGAEAPPSLQVVK